MPDALSDAEAAQFDAIVAEIGDVARPLPSRAFPFVIGFLALVGMLASIQHTAIAFAFFLALATMTGLVLRDLPVVRFREGTVTERLARLVVRGSADVAGHVWPKSYLDDAQK